jgi:hypothetical protein
MAVESESKARHVWMPYQKRVSMRLCVAVQKGWCEGDGEELESYDVKAMERSSKVMV